ncbi:MAG: T9SS type A sorting domain-containing protein, partial [candidate division WOR-3 bacterium]
VKGNGTLDFWQYDPYVSSGYKWSQQPDVPAGARTIKEGAGLAGIDVGANAHVYLLKGSGTTEFYRYVAGVGWQTMAQAPTGKSGKPFKNGSCLTLDADHQTLYALKGSYNEFFAYSIAANSWTTLTPLPLTGSAGRKKAKDGASLAYHGGTVYALKGGNTNEFWAYSLATQTWTSREDMPAGSKKVKAGGGLTYSAADNALFAFRGNNTREFWCYAPLPSGKDQEPPQQEANSAAIVGPAIPFALGITPNPTHGAVLVRYSLSQPGLARLRLFDCSGRLIQTLFAGLRAPGANSLVFTPAALARGIYILKLEALGSTQPARVLTEKLIIE